MESVSLQKEAFILNTKMQLSRAENEIDKIRMLLEKNDEIIRLRENIKKASEEKVRNGTLSVSELLRDIHSYDAAVQEKAMNRIQLVLAAYDLKYILNSWPEIQAGLQGEKK
jgi:outer membrane protein TolC